MTKTHDKASNGGGLAQSIKKGGKYYASLKDTFNRIDYFRGILKESKKWAIHRITKR